MKFSPEIMFKGVAVLWIFSVLATFLIVTICFPYIVVSVILAMITIAGIGALLGNILEYFGLLKHI